MTAPIKLRESLFHCSEAEETGVSPFFEWWAELVDLDSQVQ
jgi:hypothetical protein